MAAGDFQRSRDSRRDSFTLVQDMSSCDPMRKGEPADRGKKRADLELGDASSDRRQDLGPIQAERLIMIARGAKRERAALGRPWKTFRIFFRESPFAAASAAQRGGVAGFCRPRR